MVETASGRGTAPGRGEPGDTRHPVSVRTMRWLDEQLREWERDGLVTGTAAATIRSRYVAETKVKLLAIVTGLGVAFVAIGLIWLVAANLDGLPPLARLAAVAAVWLGLAAAAEVIRSERLTAVCRTLAAAAFGAVIFQAAQSLQVPAFEPALIGCWGLGALLYAYATRSLGAFAVGLAAGIGWFAWQIAETAHGIAETAIAVLCGAIVATAVAVAHAGRLHRARPEFATGWRLAGAGFALVGLFMAALPFGEPESGRSPWQPGVLWMLGIAAATAAAALMLAGRSTRTAIRGEDGRPPAARLGWELLVLAVILALGTALVLWQPDSGALENLDPSRMTPQLWARTTTSILVFLAAAAWFAMLGTWRDAPSLTSVALIALVLFTTFQSFAVFAPIISGATLFLAVGAVMLATGLAAERVRRRLTRRRARPGKKSTKEATS